MPLTIGILVALLVIALSAGGIWYLGQRYQTQAATPVTTSVPAETSGAPSPSAAPSSSLLPVEVPSAVSLSAAPSPPSSSAAPPPPPPSATTTVTVTKAPTTTRPPSTASAPKTTKRYLGADQQATFTYFSALLNGPPVRNGADPTELRIYVEVCVRSLPPGSTGGVTRISRDPWSVRNSKGQTGVVRQTSLTPTFPAQANGGVGSCFDGYLSYTTPNGFFDNIDFIDVVYSNGVGETAIWNFH